MEAAKQVIEPERDGAFWFSLAMWLAELEGESYLQWTERSMQTPQIAKVARPIAGDFMFGVAEHGEPFFGVPAVLDWWCSVPWSGVAVYDGELLFGGNTEFTQEEADKLAVSLPTAPEFVDLLARAQLSNVLVTKVTSAGKVWRREPTSVYLPLRHLGARHELEAWLDEL